jgi:peptidoglycan/xylan/chitin deacetylase (PgdA/CDA1 family)
MYHNFAGTGARTADAVSVADIRGQLAYLRRHYRVVPLGYILESLKSGRPFDHPTVALTVDDGRRNFYEVFFPILAEFAMSATLFVVSSFIRREDWLWTDKVSWLSDQLPQPSELSPAKIESLFAMLNQLPPESRNARIAALAARMGVSIPLEAPPKYAPCSWTELREMADSGLVEIGSHTVTHPVFASITDEQSWFELTASRTQIEEGLGRQIHTFCFPNGKPGDYRPSQLRQVMDAGYTSSVVARWGMVTSRSNPYELPRIGVSGDAEPLSFFKELDGAEYYQARLQKVFGMRDDEIW